MTARRRAIVDVPQERAARRGDARRRASASPMPDAAPVTTTRLPISRMVGSTAADRLSAAEHALDVARDQVDLG